MHQHVKIVCFFFFMAKIVDCFVSIIPFERRYVGNLNYQSVFRRDIGVKYSNNRIWLVGAGPGDPDLLTVACARLLENKELTVIADRLISPEILELVKGPLKIANKHPGCAEVC